MICTNGGKLWLGVFECIDDAKSLIIYFFLHIFIFIISFDEI